MPAPGAGVLSITPSNVDDLRAWDTEVTRMHRAGALRVVREREDTLMPGRQHERLAQYHGDLPVFGAEVTRQSEDGVPISMLGRLYRDIDVASTPQLSSGDARAVMLAQPDAESVIGGPDLLVLPLDRLPQGSSGQDAGGFVLAYRVVTTFPQDVLVSFVDAMTGRLASSSRPIPCRRRRSGSAP